MMRFVVALCLFVGLLFVAHCAWLPSKPKREEPVARWEQVFFKVIDDAVRISDLIPLRDTRLGKGDFEIRIWRFSENFEGVAFNFANGKWTSSHIVGNDNFQITSTDLSELPQPKAGWELFWNQLTELGLLTLPSTQDEDCLDGLDGMGYIVEINKDEIYRTYMYRSDMSRCPNSERMDLIAEVIGMEFHDGVQQCRTTEWFPCAHFQREYRLENEQKN